MLGIGAEAAAADAGARAGGGSTGLDVQSAGVIVQPGTGLVLGSGQNTTYSNSGGKFQTAQNLVVRANMGGGLGFQIGSTQKLFAVVNALENGWTPSSTITLPNFTTKVGDYTAAVFTPSMSNCIPTVDGRSIYRYP